MRTVSILIAVLLLGGATGATARPFSEGCKWSYYHWHDKLDGSSEISFVKLELKDSYELNGKTYCKLYETKADVDGSIGEERFLLGLREEGGCVYANYDEFMKAPGVCVDPEATKDDPYHMPHIVTEDNEVLLYNFNLNAGDFIGLSDIIVTPYVESVRPIVMETGEERKLYGIGRYLHLEDGVVDEGWRGNVISGIGSINCWGGLIAYLTEFIITFDGLRRDNLNLYIEDNTIVYKAPEYTGDPDAEHMSYTTYHPDPFFGDLVTGVKEVKPGAEANRSEAIYDLGGRRMDGKLKPGVYIRGGRKIVIK